MSLLRVMKLVSLADALHDGHGISEHVPNFRVHGAIIYLEALNPHALANEAVSLDLSGAITAENVATVCDEHLDRRLIRRQKAALVAMDPEHSVKFNTSSYNSDGRD